MNVEENILGGFVKIIDSTKCLKNLNQKNETNTSWPNQQIRNKACEREWNQYNYYPMIGHIGEVVSRLNIEVFKEPVYIIRTYGMFYVPIFKSGFQMFDV